MLVFMFLVGFVVASVFYFPRENKMRDKIAKEILAMEDFCKDDPSMVDKVDAAMVVKHGPGPITLFK